MILDVLLATTEVLLTRSANSVPSLVQNVLILSQMELLVQLAQLNISVRAMFASLVQ